MKWYYSVYIQDRHTSTDKCESINANYGSEILRKLYSMIGYILNKYVNPRIIHKSRRSIKLFMSFIDKFDNHYNKTWLKSTNKIPIWLSKYNFQSLLNVPNLMELYGHMINLWECSCQGEGYLRYVKPKIHSIKTKNWHLNAH